MPAREWGVYTTVGLLCLACGGAASAQRAAPAAAEDCAPLVRAVCLDRLGAGAAAMGDGCDAEWSAYRECLSKAAGGVRSPGGADNAEAKEAFDYAKSVGSMEAYLDVAGVFPDTFWGRQAAREARRLQEAARRGDARPKPPASAAPSVKKPAENPKRALVRALQTELNRLGCNAGRPDGVWGARSARALAAFKRENGGAFAADAPSERALSAVKTASRTASGRVCPRAPATRSAQKQEPPAKPKGTYHRAGIGWNWGSEAAAKNAAMVSCLKGTAESAAQALSGTECQPEIWVRNLCMAFAENKSGQWGVAGRKNLSAAKNVARDICNTNDPGDSCKVTLSACSKSGHGAIAVSKGAFRVTR